MRALGDAKAAVYEVAEKWVDASLRRDDSLFTPGVPIWSAANLTDLYQRFTLKPDESGDSFEAKFRRQLDGAAAQTYQLAGEVMYAHYLIARDIRGQTKRKHIDSVLKLVTFAGLHSTRALAVVLDEGICSTGQGFKNYKPNQLWLLIDFFSEWKKASRADRDAWLSDPWAFKEKLYSIPQKAAQTQQAAILHLVFPDTFEDMVSRDRKAIIVKRFHDLVEAPTDDVDRALAQIRTALSPTYGADFDFWDQPLRVLWDVTKGLPEDQDEASPSAPSARAWLVRGSNVDGENLVPRWVTEGWCSIGWHELGEVPTDISRRALRERVRETYPDETEGHIAASTGNIYRFLRRMKPGDRVVTASGQDIYVGIIASDPHWDDDVPGAVHRRSVDWANPNEPLPRSSLPPTLFSKLRTLLTVSDLSDSVADIDALIAVQPSPTPSLDVMLREPDEELAEQLFLPVSWLSKIRGLLQRKRQVIFYGPPGTGKTFVAEALADFLAGDEANTKLVQFHPSYAYEDFVEGFRPRELEDQTGGMGFELRPGPFRELADAARDDRTHAYVLIIDEINRANIAKVFGEFYFLLEYRDRTIDLQYSREQSFTLPNNLFVIGTMNTADRSIALVDAAMRRRFYLVPFFPRDPNVKTMLRLWLDNRGCSPLAADVLEELNRRIDDPDFAVGPSYFMSPHIDEPGELELVFEHAILPLLEEQYFGTDIDVEARFSLEAIRRALLTATRNEADDGAY